MTNLATNLTTTAAEQPEKDALRVNGQGVTYAQLHGMAAKVAGTLRANGIEPGDRVALILPNVPAFPVVYWGVLLAGGVVVPMNPLLKSGEIEYFFTDSGAKIAFVWPDFVGEATKGAASSGTRIVETGPMGPNDFEGGDPIAEPTPARGRRRRGHPLHLGHDGTAQGRRAHPPQPPPQRDPLGPGHPDDDLRRRRLGCLPLFHFFGLDVGLNAATIAGASLTLLPRFDPQAAIEVIERERVTLLRACRPCTSRSSTTPRPTAWTPHPCGPASPAAPRCRSR